jgi:hypothetical protein
LKNSKETLEEKFERLNKSNNQNIEDGQSMGHLGKRLLAAYLSAFGILLIYLLYVFWPGEIGGAIVTLPPPSTSNQTANASSPATETIVTTPASESSSSENTTTSLTIFFIKISHVPIELKLLLAVVVMGMIGRHVHNLISFIDFTGNRTLVRSWRWQYVLSPMQGGLLALVFYLVIRGGMLTAGSNAQQDLNKYGILAISALAGLFSMQAVGKLGEIADTIFRKTKEERGDTLTAPKPKITNIDPELIQDQTKTLARISGEGFTPNSSVFVDGTKRSILYINSNEIQVDISDLEEPKGKSPKFKISNPVSGGGETDDVSQELDFYPTPVINEVERVSGTDTIKISGKGFIRTSRVNISGGTTEITDRKPVAIGNKQIQLDIKDVAENTKVKLKVINSRKTATREPIESTDFDWTVPPK